MSDTSEPQPETPEEVEAVAVVVPPRRRTTWISRIGAIVAVVGLAAFLVVRQQAWAARAACFDELHARGEPALFSEIGDGGPMDGTAVPKVIEACRLLGTTCKFDEKAQALTDAPFEKNTIIDAALTKLKPVRALIAESVDLPPGQLTRELNQLNPMATMLDHVQELRAVARMQQLAIIQAVADKRPRDAYRELAVLLKLPRLLSREPFVVAHLVRLAILGVGRDSLQRLVVAVEPTDDEFLAIDRLLTESGDDLDMGIAMRDQRGMILSFIEDPGLVAPRPSNDDRIPYSAWRTLWLSPLCDARRWSQQTAASVALDDWVETTRKPGVEPQSAMAEWETRHAGTLRRIPVLRLLMGAMEMALEANLRSKSRLAATRYALRVHRHKTKTGKLPESLAEIAEPAFPVAATPLFGGKLPTYERDPKGFTISTSRPLSGLIAAEWGARIQYIPDPPKPPMPEDE